MDTMDLKGIAWVGNIYQKFEAMCLEVEETMCEETAKYVENQVQTMGASMKRFYSDVMQDLLPPSSIDPVKVSTADLLLNPYADLLLNPYADVAIQKKPKTCIKEDTKKLVSLNGISEDNSPPSEKSNLYADLLLNPYANVAIQKKPKTSIMEDTKKLVSINGISEDNSPPSEKSSLSNEVSRDRSTGSLIGELSEEDGAACDLIDMISPQASVEVVGCDSRGEEQGEIYNCMLDEDVSIDDVSIASPASGAVVLIESSAKKGKRLRNIFSNKSLIAKSTDTRGDSGSVSQIGSYASVDTQYGQSADEEVFVCHTGRLDDCNLDMIEKDDTIKPRMGTIGQDSESNLEETCVLVDGDDFCPVARKESKNRSYKKKIRQAFSLKMKPVRKREYEQLAAQYGNVDTQSKLESVEAVMPTIAANSNSKKSPTHDFAESEWEIL